MAYLDLAKNGKNQWWRYLFGIIFVTIMLQGVGAVPFLILLQIVENDQDETTFFNPETLVVEGIDVTITFIAMMLPFIFALLGLWLTIRFLHKRPFHSLITSVNKINWTRIAQGAGVFIVITSVIGFADMLFSPNMYQFTFQSEKFLPFLLMVLLLTPIQAITEELLFRGYLMQGLGLMMNKWGAAVLSSLLFALMHFASAGVWTSPIMAILALFITGMFLALVTLRDGTLELAMGVHTANNLVAFLLIAPKEATDMNFPAVFTNMADMFGWKPLLMFVLAVVLFWLVIFKWLSCPPATSSLQENT